MRRLGCLFGLLMAFGAEASDLPKLTAMQSSLWSGWHFGGHLGYLGGSSSWSNLASGHSLNGRADLTDGFNLFKGSGSFFGGLQVGYSVALPSRLLLGFEVDASAPNLVSGKTVVPHPAGAASYADTVLHFGSVRGRVGYVLDNNWLAYGTGGFAWSYDQLNRTQNLEGAQPTSFEQRSLQWRWGFAAGAGVEIPVASDWSARAEYLHSGFRRRTSLSVPEANSSDLSLHEIRFGLNYRLYGSDGAGQKTQPSITKALSAYTEDLWAVHGQSTFVSQYAAPFRAPYRGPNSLAANSGRETWDATAYIGMRLWNGAEAWVNPEIDQGFGLSGTLGVAGFTSGEAYKKGADYPYTRLHRAFIRQTVNLGGETQRVDAGINQFATTQTSNRLVFTVGKFSVGDIFDVNRYAHDPRSDFLNWSIIDAGTFDYAAEAWGYSMGAAAEWYQGNWTFRGGLFDMSIVPNSTDLDPRFEQFQWVGEIERRHDLWGLPGKVALTGFLSRGRMGKFQDAIQFAQRNGGAADLSAVRSYRSRGGVSVNVEQQVTADVGFFARAGWANGSVEPYEFTDIDRTVAAGLSINGMRWGRAHDTFGIAGVVNGITNIHKAYLDAGGLGILIGDGQLPRSGKERILEAYYSFPVSFARVTLDYQLIVNPGYNVERGPVSVFATRVRTQF